MARSAWFQLMVATRPRLVSITLMVSLPLLASACGSSETAGNEATSSSSTSSSTSSTTEAPTTSQAADVDDTTSSESTSTTVTTSTTTTTTTEPVSTAIAPVGLDQIPDLIAEWGAGTGDPLDLAERIVGFPISVDVPPGSTPHHMSVRLRADETGAAWRWEWSYEAISSQPIGDIDAELPEGGPGTIETRLNYDPIMESLGWRNTGQVISDPSSGAGGPQSINFIYQLNAETIPLGEVAATPVVARVWAEEDMIFGDDREPGYEIEIILDSVPDLIPVPMLQTLADELPVVPGAVLTELRLLTQERSADSFDADEGLRYIDLEYTYRLDPGTAESAREAYSTGLEGSAYQAGEESFFDEGFIEVVEASVSGDTWTQRVIVLDRYPGEIHVIEDPATGTAVSVLEMRLEPNREPLELLAE